MGNLDIHNLAVLDQGWVYWIDEPAVRCEFQLGIALHLIADSATPTHNKPRAHFPFLLKDNLEKFINKNLLLAEIQVENIKMTVKNSLDEYYHDLAKSTHDFKTGKIGLLALLLRVFGCKKMPKQDLIIQTKEIIPASISYTMGVMNLFYKEIKK